MFDYESTCRVDGAVSDLFFNHDFTHCRDDEGEWNIPELEAEADSFLYLVRALRPDLNYTVSDLLGDFFGRM